MYFNPLFSHRRPASLYEEDVLSCSVGISGVVGSPDSFAAATQNICRQGGGAKAMAAAAAPNSGAYAPYWLRLSQRAASARLHSAADSGDVRSGPRQPALKAHRPRNETFEHIPFPNRCLGRER